MYALGIDLGSSSIKVSVVDTRTSKAVGVVQEPDSEMSIEAPKPGWAEQDPDMWWNYTCRAIRRLLAKHELDPAEIRSIGIAYQMHGLVMVDKAGKVLRPAIIWCDSRAVGIGAHAFDSLGRDWCLTNCLNSPGNFTASKLRWVKDNEPDVYDQIDKIMLPGDYLGYRLTGQIVTTISGLSEGVMWDFRNHKPSGEVLSYMGVREDFMPEVADSIGDHGRVSSRASEECGLAAGTSVTYRAGDQPNNAMSLGVLGPGEVAATGGTSGVIYAVSDQLVSDPLSRVNGFAHVNHSFSEPRIGILLCINGAGILHAWMRKNVANGMSFSEMEMLAASVRSGSDGLLVIPFGNGAERLLENHNAGMHIGNLVLNRHGQAHVIRAGLEGIAFSFVYGFEIMKEMGVRPDVIRVGNDNLFRSKIFGSTVAALLECPIEVVDTTGATGAARASAVGIGAYPTLESAFSGLNTVHTYIPHESPAASIDDYQNWKTYLGKILN